MHIRPARVEEVEALGHLAWAAKASWGYSPAQLHEWREDLGPSPSSIAEQPTFVAELHDRLVGFCQLNLELSPVGLEHLWVQPEFMGQGVGRALLSCCLRHLREHGVEVLHIDSDPNAERFYRACGAVCVGEIAAPIEGQPERMRPQLRLSTAQTWPVHQADVSQ